MRTKSESRRMTRCRETEVHPAGVRPELALMRYFGTERRRRGVAGGEIKRSQRRVELAVRKASDVTRSSVIARRASHSPEATPRRLRVPRLVNFFASGLGLIEWVLDPLSNAPLHVSEEWIVA